MTTTKFFQTGYMDKALTPGGLESIITAAKRELADVDFDTLVGTGFSGGVVIPALAMALGKNFVLVRKEEDTSHHGPGKLLGTLGKRWIFVDDFISTGATKRRVLDKVTEAAGVGERRYNAVKMEYEYGPAYETTYLGDYTYITYDKPGWQPAGENA